MEESGSSEREREGGVERTSKSRRRGKQKEIK